MFAFHGLIIQVDKGISSSHCQVCIMAIPTGQVRYIKDLPWCCAVWFESLECEEEDLSNSMSHEMRAESGLPKTPVSSQGPRKLQQGLGRYGGLRMNSKGGRDPGGTC